MAFERYLVIRLPVDEEVADGACGHHAGKRAYSLHRFDKESGGFLAVIVGARQVDLEQQHVAGVKSPFGGLYSHKAANQQAGAGKQDYSESQLNDHQ